MSSGRNITTYIGERETDGHISAAKDKSYIQTLTYSNWGSNPIIVDKYDQIYLPTRFLFANTSSFQTFLFNQGNTKTATCTIIVNGEVQIFDTITGAPSSDTESLSVYRNKLC